MGFVKMKQISKLQNSQEHMLFLGVKTKYIKLFNKHKLMNVISQLLMIF